MLPESEAKIERSKEQISNLKTEMDSFLETKPSVVVREDDPQTGEWVYRFRSNRDVPLRFSVIVGEILHNLRSSLDQLACHLIRRNSGEKAITSQSGFPVPNVAKDFKSLLGCKVKGARTEVMDIIT